MLKHNPRARNRSKKILRENWRAVPAGGVLLLKSHSFKQTSLLSVAQCRTEPLEDCDDAACVARKPTWTCVFLVPWIRERKSKWYLSSHGPRVQPQLLTEKKGGCKCFTVFLRSVWYGFTLPETNRQFVPENGPEPQKETIVIPTDSNHPFSGAMLSGQFF